MDTLTFISNLIGSLAWPLAVVLVVWWLRKEIRKLLPFAKKLRYGDLEIEFEQQLAALKKDAESQKRTHAVLPKPEDAEVVSYLKSAAEVSPRAALVDAWVGLEITAVSSAQMLKLIPEQKTVPFPKVVSALRDSGVLEAKDVEILNRLRALRNDALHSPGFQLSPEEAQEFISLIREQSELIASEAFQKKGGCGH